MPRYDEALNTTPRTAQMKKMTELVLYFSAQSSEDPAWGVNKLCKLLFFADFGFFAKFGRSITGFEYMKLGHGPVPVGLNRLLDEMVDAQKLAWEQRDRAGRVQKRPMALHDPVLAEFNGEEIAFIDEIVTRFRQHSARDISARSHQFAGWKVAREMEVIPYTTSLISGIPLSEEQILYGQRLAEEWRQGLLD